MIRVNLLAIERARETRKARFNATQKWAVACSTIVVIAAVFIGWRYLTLQRESKELDDQIAAAKRETARLDSIIKQVDEFDKRKKQLQERVTLIEELRKGQNGPVHLLDQISRALPTMVWLTELKQNEKVPGEVSILGKCTNLTELSDFASNLKTSGYFTKIDIVSTKTEAEKDKVASEIIAFELKAMFATPAPPGTPPAAPAAATPGKTGG